MSSPEKSETLAAHPTAVKAGGMRIVQDKSHIKKKSEPVPQPEEDALKVSNSPPKQTDLMSGATSRGLNADFPVAAVQAFHEKPIPKIGSQSSHKPNVHIQQPKK